MFSVIMILWTYQQIKEHGSRKADAIAQSRPDIRIIHIPVETASINRGVQEIDLERGINLPAQEIPTDDAPPYESIANTPNDI